MNFAKITKQQQLAKPAAAPATYSTTRPLGINSSSSSHIVLPLPRTLITAQHCFSKQQQTPSPPPYIGLMIKNIENCSNQTDCDENEEEKDKEICNVLQRRESVAEDAPTFSTLKLNTIQESAEISTSTEASSQSSTQNLSSSLQLETFSTPTIASPETTTADLSSSTEEQQISTTHSIEHFNYSYSSTSSSINNQTGDINVISSLAEETSNLYLSTATAKGQQGKDNSSSSESPRGESLGASFREKHNKSLSSSKILSTSQNAGGSASSGRRDEDTISKSSDTSGELARSLPTPDSTTNAGEKPPKTSSKLSERAKKKSWYNVLYPNYKSRSQDFKKLFKTVPNDERLIVDYSCALQRDILVQGRLYVSQNYVCFHANIFSWETYLTITWKDVTSITKEKTALVIPNAISICTAKEKYFFATFTSRDKAYLMLFRIWQNTLMNKQMPPQEMWKWVHNCYGDELGLTTDDEDYIDPTSVLTKTDDDGETDFVSALDDTESRKSVTNNSEYITSPSSSNPFGGNSGSGRNQRNSGSSSTGSGSGSIKKTKTRSYFFGSNKSSTTASASGSDNKASDNNSGADRKTKNQTMKPNAKELTLTSAKPDESTGAAVASNSGGAVAANGEAKEAKNDSKRKVSKNTRQRDESLNKNSEALPTDMSDSSDSDENKIPFVATAECTSTHEGRQLVHTILPINIETLFNLLFSKSKFLVDFHAMRKSTDTNFGEWTTNEEGQQVRTVNVTVQLAASVGPKTSKVTEHQVMRECSKPGELYSIDINSVNAGIPYADSFSVQMHYCLVRTIDDHTMLSVHAQIKYKKSIWGVVKGFIEKNTWAGLEDFYTALLHALQSETCIPPAKGKGRRPRRGKHKTNANASTNVTTANANVSSHNATIASTNCTTTTATCTTTSLSSTTTDNDSLYHDNNCCCCSEGDGDAHQLLFYHHHHHQKHMPRLGTATQIRPIEESPQSPTKLEPSDNVLSTHTMSAHLPKANKVLLPGDEYKRNYKWLSIFVIGILFFLLALNVILLFKLWKLEERIEVDLESRARMPNLSQLKQLPNNHQDWIQLLRQQEILHEEELKKWHTVLQTAIELLKKTEKTLAELMFR